MWLGKKPILMGSKDQELFKIRGTNHSWTQDRSVRVNQKKKMRTKKRERRVKKRAIARITLTKKSTRRLEITSIIARWKRLN